MYCQYIFLSSYCRSIRPNLGPKTFTISKMEEVGESPVSHDIETSFHGTRYKSVTDERYHYVYELTDKYKAFVRRPGRQ